MKTPPFCTEVLFRQWHIRLFSIMAAAVLEGENPWNFVAKSIHDTSSGNKWAIIPKVARVPHQKYQSPFGVFGLSQWKINFLMFQDKQSLYQSLK